MGAPVDFPSNKPLRNSIRSASAREVVTQLCPGRRRLSSFCTKLISITTPAGMPSITPPTATPWLSPKVVSRKRCPKLFRIAQTTYSFFNGNRHNRHRIRRAHNRHYGILRRVRRAHNRHYDNLHHSLHSCVRHATS